MGIYLKGKTRATGGFAAEILSMWQFWRYVFIKYVETVNERLHNWPIFGADFAVAFGFLHKSVKEYITNVTKHSI